jgi:hypothetical protein
VIYRVVIYRVVIYRAVIYKVVLIKKNQILMMVAEAYPVCK